METKCYCRLVLLVTGDGYSDQSPPGFLLSIQTAQVSGATRGRGYEESTSHGSVEDSSSSDSAVESLPDYTKDKAKIPLHKWSVKHTVLFGCGEGSRRCLNEQHVKLRSLRGICLTNDHLNSISGIPSTLFHMGDTGCKEVTVCGPGDIHSTMEGVNETFGRKYPVTTVEVPGQQTWREILSMPLYGAAEKTKGCPDQHIRVTSLNPSAPPTPNRERSSSSDSTSSVTSSDSSSSSSSSSSSDTTTPDHQVRQSSDNEVASPVENSPSEDTSFMNSLKRKICNAKRSADDISLKDEKNDLKRARMENGGNVPTRDASQRKCSRNVRSSVYCVQLGLGSKGEDIPVLLVIDIDGIPEETSYEWLFSHLRKRCKSQIQVVLFSSVRSEEKHFDFHATLVSKAFEGVNVVLMRVGEGNNNDKVQPASPYLFAFWKAARLQAQMALFDDEVYPFPMLRHLPADVTALCKEKQCLQTLDTVQLWPFYSNFAQSTEHVAPQNHFESMGWRELVSSEVKGHEEINGNLKYQQLLELLAQTKAHTPSERPVVLESNAEGGHSQIATVYILGTGASTPGKYRSNTGIYVSLEPVKLRSLLSGSSREEVVPQGILLDCGEGVLAGFSRLFNSKNSDTTRSALASVLKGLKVIWISHHHTDHHSGLLSLLGKRQELLQQTNLSGLVLVCPPKVRKSIDFYRKGINSELNPLHSVTMVDPQDFNSPLNTHRQEVLTGTLGDALSQESSISSFLSVPVEHCPDAYGVVLILKGKHGSSSGTKVVFSGDTRPCKRLIAAGSGASLLIHEATFEDSLASHAARKRHCTVSEALDVGTRMDASAIVLTHFSQRYSKIGPELPTENRKAIFCNAYDGMRLNIGTDEKAIVDSCNRANAAEKLLCKVDEELTNNTTPE